MLNLLNQTINQNIQPIAVLNEVYKLLERLFMNIISQRILESVKYEQVQSTPYVH